MIPERTYEVDFNRLAVMLLPTFLRRARMVALVVSFFSPLAWLWARFIAFRRQANYRLTHNSQVCYLRAVLNDTFDADQRRIDVQDVPRLGDAVVLYPRQEDKPVIITADTVIVYPRGFTGEGLYDFVVVLPAELAGVDRLRLTALVNQYKLAGKHFTIITR